MCVIITVGDVSFSLSLTDVSDTSRSPQVNRMLFAPEQQDSAAAVPGVDELSLGLLFLSLPCWSRPEPQRLTQPYAQTPSE